MPGMCLVPVKSSDAPDEAVMLLDRQSRDGLPKGKRVKLRITSAGGAFVVRGPLLHLTGHHFTHKMDCLLVKYTHPFSPATMWKW